MADTPAPAAGTPEPTLCHCGHAASKHRPTRTGKSHCQDCCAPGETECYHEFWPARSASVHDRFCPLHGVLPALPTDGGSWWQCPDCSHNKTASLSAPAETPPAAEPRTPIYRCNTEGCSAGDCENCLAVAELRAALEAGAADTPKRSNSVLLWAADAALQTWQRGLPMEVAMGDLDLALNAFRGPDDEPSAFAAPLTETTDG